MAVKYFKFPITFDSGKMQAEVQKLADGYWRTHYQANDFEGDWTVLSLRSVLGKPEMIYSVRMDTAPAGVYYSNTPLAEQCPYLMQVTDYFQCEKAAVRLMKLNAGSTIKKHNDGDLCYEGGELRIHVPVQTNDKVEFCVEDERIPMKEGECWYVDFSREHHVNNFGSTDRIHLVIDCKLNDWLKELMKDGLQNEWEKSLSFLKDIGIETSLQQLGDDTFLPGISIVEGRIVIDADKLKYPGDILHEAGHIAVVPASERKTMNAASIKEREMREAEEMMAIAWSYAACVHLNIDPSYVFHDQGYHGGGANIVENFRNKRYIGVPMLQWTGMAVDEKTGSETKRPCYPEMIKWMRD